MVNYADDNTPCPFSPELDIALRRLKNYSIKIFEWFQKKPFYNVTFKLQVIQIRDFSGRSRTAATSKMEIFVIIVNGFRL